MRLLERFKPDYLAYIGLAGAMAIIALIRLIPYDRVVGADRVFYSGNDPWYHMRMVHLIVDKFPHRPIFDAYTYFPFGTGQKTGFGGLFDQVIAFAAIVAGLGSPSDHLVDVVGAVAPVAFATLTVLPMYYVVRHLADRWSGVLAALLLSLFTGQFLNRTIVGSPDHQSAEALFSTLAVAGVVMTVKYAYVEKPTLAHVRDRDWAGLRRPMSIFALAGAFVASYLMMWPPGVMLIATFGIFVIVQLTREHLRGDPTEYLAFGTAATFGTAGVLTLLNANHLSMDQSTFSLLQPLTVFGVAAGAVFLHVLSRAYDERDIDKLYHPATTLGLFIATLVLMQLLYPQGINMLVSLVERIYSFGLLTSAGAQTVAEIAPASPTQAWQAFGLLFFVSIGALAVLLYRVILEDRPLELLVFLWSLTMFSAYFTMIRFGYYVAVNVAVLSAFALWWFVTDIFEIDFRDRSIEDVKGYEVITLLILVLVILPGNVIAVGPSGPPAWDLAQRMGGTNSDWVESLDWMEENTPDPGLDYAARYDRPEDGDYQYPVDASPLEGAYGVMSWWDYGHWITTQARRIPNANPFQQGQYASSDFMVAQSERRSNLVLDALPGLDDVETRVDRLSDGELRDVTGNLSEQERYEDTRYVMIDDQSAANKFGAIATWTNFTGYVSRQSFRYNNESRAFPALNDKYQNTTLSRLYYGDADGMGHYRLVHETERFAVIGNLLDLRSGRLTGLNRVLFRRNHDESFPQTDLPMTRIDSLPDEQTIPRGGNQLLYDLRGAAAVKTFERVEGATITGEADVTNATTVTAVLQLETTNTNRNFTYTRTTETAPDGSFELTVAYPSEDDVTVAQGGTDAAVEAESSYDVYVGDVSVRKLLGQTLVLGNRSETGTVEVTERAVYEGSAVPVTLEPAEGGGLGGVTQESLNLTG